MTEWLLTEKEMEDVVHKFLYEDSVRELRLMRGHWEDVGGVIAKAQLRKIAAMLTPSAIEPDWAFIRNLTEFCKEAGLDG